MKMLDLIEKLARGEAPPPPVATLIGFSLASIEPGRAVIEFEATERHANPMGTLHGGILADIADAEGRVLSGGRTIGLVECHVRDAKDRLIAHATGTCMTLRGDAAAGR